jgi:hypothetical protein
MIAAVDLTASINAERAASLPFFNRNDPRSSSKLLKLLEASTVAEPIYTDFQPHFTSCFYLDILKNEPWVASWISEG